MGVKVKKHGKYELFETTKGHQILTLDGKEYYALIEGQKGDIIVHSDADHKKSKTIQKGEFYLADFEDDPEFRDQPHLFMQKGKQFTEMILPNGLPTKNDYQKKLVRTNEKIGKDKIKDRIGGKGTKKQYRGKPDSLRSKSRQELYEMAQKADVHGRSKMDKEDLVKSLKGQK